MTVSAEVFASWLALSDPAALISAVQAGGGALTLPQANRLTLRLQGLEVAASPLRIGLVHTYTSDLLEPWLRCEGALHGFAPLVYHAPYGYLRQEAQPDSGLVRHAPDLTVLLLCREDLHPALCQPVALLDTNARVEVKDAALNALLDLLIALRARVPGQLLLTLLPPLQGPGLGLYDSSACNSEAHWWAGFKAALAARMTAEVAGAMFLDLDLALADIGRAGYFDLRYWFSSRFPFAPAGARDLARRVMAIATARRLPKAKVIALDADNTLWGGILGEDGVAGVALGHDYPGNCYLAFQRRLLDFQNRGFLLALCSKNNPADVEEMLNSHPLQLLRGGQFAARRVNWLDKPRNLIDLAAELNLGLDAFVFVDDSDHECAAVRSELPQVQVVQVPRRAVEIPGCLDRIARLEVLSLTDEDRARGDLYAQERQRRELAAQVNDSGGGMDDYLRSLRMHMRIGINDLAQLPRLTQLVNKTNQFNLTSRRYDEQQMRGLMVADDTLVAHFSLADVFGDSGIVGLAIIRREAGWAAIDSLLLSCRVIGRRAETAFLETLLRLLADAGVDEVWGDYLPSAKNALVSDFYPVHGFTATVDGRFRRDLHAAPPAAADAWPIAVELSVAPGVPAIDPEGRSNDSV